MEDAPSSSKNGLLDTEWFYGPMTRQDAEKLLSRDGDFLVRESTTNPGQYVLTGQQNGYPKHLLLVDPQGVVSFSSTKVMGTQTVDLFIIQLCFDEYR